MKKKRKKRGKNIMCPKVQVSLYVHRHTSTQTWTNENGLLTLTLLYRQSEYKERKNGSLDGKKGKLRCDTCENKNVMRREKKESFFMCLRDK